MDELKLRKQSERAGHAKRVMEDEIVVEALNLIRSNLHAVWEASKFENVPEREEAWKTLKVLNEFERYFLKVMEDGKIAEKESSLMEKAKEKLKSFI